jgi:hypothetical protein
MLSDPIPPTTQFNYFDPFQFKTLRPQPTSKTNKQEEVNMDTRKGGHRYCPNCKKVVETRVLLEGYCQTDFRGIPAKKRQIIFGTDAEGLNGCGTRWFTLEILEDQV